METSVRTERKRVQPGRAKSFAFELERRLERNEGDTELDGARMGLDGGKWKERRSAR